MMSSSAFGIVGSNTVRPLVRIEGIDRLRAFAALSVFLAHVVGPELPGVLRYLFTGHPAVVAFFVVSGFCIHRPYVERPLPLVAFWASRATRILPPTFVAYYLAKVLCIREFNFVDGYILWSVVCELWYYLFYPLIFLFSRFISWSGLVAISVVVWLIVIISAKHDEYGNANNYGLWVNWLVGLPSWLIGCALAERRRFPASIMPIVIWRALVAFTASMLYWATLNTRLGFYITANPFALLVMGWISAEIASARNAGFFDWIGRWSFSLYLFHIIVETALLRLGVQSVLLIVPLVMAGCFFLSCVFEMPAHRLARLVFHRLAPHMRLHR